MRRLPKYQYVFAGRRCICITSSDISQVSNNLMKYSVKEYLFKAGLCHLATGDPVSITRALEKYRDLDPSFTAQREYQLLVDLSTAVEAGDQEQFSEKLYQFDQMSKLDKWKTSILLKVNKPNHRPKITK